MTEQTDLNHVVRKFVDAERVLVELRAEQQRLLAASTALANADTQLRERTEVSLQALEEARARLREQMVRGAEISTAIGGLHDALARLASEMSAVLLTLREIDPAAMTRDLAELKESTSVLAQTHQRLVDVHDISLRRLTWLSRVGVATFVTSLAAVVVGVLL